MTFLFCPKCNHFEARKSSDGLAEYDERTVKQLDALDVGQHIQFYRCECGNYLAGYTECNGGADEEYQTMPDDVKDAVHMAFKNTVAAFNEGGAVYGNEFVGELNTYSNFGELAMWCYHDRKGKEQTTPTEGQEG